jgi:hypothetical protein
MRRFTIYSIVMIGLLVINAGCQTGARKKPRKPYTAADNPTVVSGRGAPSLDDVMRPAAWVLIDGYEGEYIEVDGNPHVEWVIDAPVSSTPTFRAEVATELLATPTDFKCALKSRDDAGDGPVRVYYGIAAEEGTFQVGKNYSLVAPGKNFVIRNAAGDIVEEIGPLPAGDYLVAAGIKNTETDKEALAITYFTVE